MRADNSQHIVDAARQRSEYTRAKAVQALRSLDAAGEPVTFETVAKQAGVSRSWLYAQPDLRAEIEQLRAVQRRAPTSPVPTRQRASDASLRRRLEAANERIQRLTNENRQLRAHLAGALGEQRAARSHTSTRGAASMHEGVDIADPVRSFPQGGGHL
jgi:murein DD-endopeptidase MepM/ murein hydrolase activator NlpD